MDYYKVLKLDFLAFNQKFVSPIVILSYITAYFPELADILHT